MAQVRKACYIPLSMHYARSRVKILLIVTLPSKWSWKYIIVTKWYNVLISRINQFRGKRTSTAYTITSYSDAILPLYHMRAGTYKFLIRGNAWCPIDQIILCQMLWHKMRKKLCKTVQSHAVPLNVLLLTPLNPLQSFVLNQSGTKPNLVAKILPTKYGDRLA